MRKTEKVQVRILCNAQEDQWGHFGSAAAGRKPILYLPKAVYLHKISNISVFHIECGKTIQLANIVQYKTCSILIPIRYLLETLSPYQMGAHPDTGASMNHFAIWRAGRHYLSGTFPCREK